VFRIAVTSQLGILLRQALTSAPVQSPHNCLVPSQIVPFPLPVQWLLPRHSTQAPDCAPFCTQAGNSAVGHEAVAFEPWSPLHAAQTLCAGVVLQMGDVAAQALRLAAVQVPQVPLAVSQSGPSRLPTQFASLPHSAHWPASAPEPMQMGDPAIGQASPPPPKSAAQPVQALVVRLQRGVLPLHSGNAMQPPHNPVAMLAPLQVVPVKPTPVAVNSPTDVASFAATGDALQLLVLGLAPVPDHKPATPALAVPLQVPEAELR